MIAEAKKGHLTMEAAYNALKAISYPWLIRRCADSKNGNGEPLVDLAKHVFHDLSLCNGGATSKMELLLRDRAKSQTKRYLNKDKRNCET
jgi:hypothetical protein